MRHEQSLSGERSLFRDKLFREAAEVLVIAQQGSASDGILGNEHYLEFP